MPGKVSGHKLTIVQSTEPLKADRAHEGYCTCGWQESGSTLHTIHSEYRQHLNKVRPTKIHPKDILLEDVQVLEAQGPLRLRRMIIKIKGTSIIDWETMQRLKDEYLGAETYAVEVYPPKDRVINEKNWRHLWELPSTFPLGFQLGDFSDNNRSYTLMLNEY